MSWWEYDLCKYQVFICLTKSQRELKYLYLFNPKTKSAHVIP